MVAGEPRSSSIASTVAGSVPFSGRDSPRASSLATLAGRGATRRLATSVTYRAARSAASDSNLSIATSRITSGAHLLCPDQPPRFGRIEPPRIEIGRKVKCVADSPGEGGDLTRHAHELKNVRRWRCEKRVRPLHDPLGIVPEVIKSLLHPSGVERLLPMFQDAIHVDLCCL